MSQLRLALAVAAACAAALAATAPAHAGTAFVAGSVLHYDAPPGEVNAVSVTAFSDHFAVTESSAPLVAGAGCTLETPHTVSCAAGESSVQVSLGDENDQYSGSGGSAGYELQIETGPGDDTVDGLDLPVGATIHGGPGDDVLRGSDRFADTVFGDDGDDTLGGDDGASQFQGGDDTLDGGDGNDTLEGDFGADDLSGGPGVDLADYSHHVEDVLLSLDDVPNDGGVGEADNVHSDVENVFGTSGADVITGSDGANDLDGWWGDDTIQGAGGDDVLTADRGGDDLQGGPGNDQLFDLRGDPCFCEIEPDAFDGGDGTDSAIFSGRADGIHVSLDDLADDGASGEGDNVHSNIENVVGGAGNDVLVGDSQDQTLDGSGGDDVLDGGAGSDLLIGGTGTDTVSYEQRTASVNVTLDGVANDGGSGENDWVALDVEGVTGGTAGDYLTGGDRRDTISGLGGPDVIDGGREEDVLSGGAGDDSITSRELEGFSDSVSCGAGTDSVTADSFDVIDPDCEYVNGSGPPPPPPPPPPVPPPPAPPPPAPPPPPPPPPPPAPPVRCRVPKVTGLRLGAARTKIRRAHCSVGRVRRARSRRVGRVVRQSPRAGAVRARGAKVSLVVGRR